MSNVDESCITLPAYHSDAAHSLLARSLSHAAAAAVLLPSAEDALSPVGCRLETSSCHGVDVTDYDVTDRAVTVCLEHKDLWSKFKTLGTEMVITKSGRYTYLSYIGLLCESLDLYLIGLGLGLYMVTYSATA